MNKFLKGASFYLIIFLAIVAIVYVYGGNTEEPLSLTATKFTEKLESDEIVSAKLVDEDNGVTIVTGELKSGEVYKAKIPRLLSSEVGNRLYSQMEQKKVLISGQEASSPPWYLSMLPTIFLILLLVGFWFMFMKNSQGGGSNVMSFGKSKAKLNKKDESKKITFDDIAGLKEEREEMKEIVDYLKSPKKYIDLGARIPKGVLMVGPPGTGKTYLTRAVAGEADVPFYSISGSNFVEMFVGVGASRVRDLFKEAKENSPCLVFIDEIDAVGRKRGAGLGGGHDEREQTLNQLLIEMDGFDENEGIILIAATNRPDILDPALLRAGRFDRQVTVGMPDIREREEVLRIHSRNKPMADDVDLSVIAKGTPGFTPADLENLLNEAALLSARINDSQIRMETLEQAKLKVIAGVEKKSRVMSEEEKRLTAYHEAGHALLARELPDTDPVHQVSIIPRGKAGGFTLQLPEEDRRYQTKSGLEKDLIILLGGRVAEKIVLGDISTGASNDLSRVTKIARAMVTKYAMSDNLSSMSYDAGDEVFLGKDMTSKKEYSEQVAAEIDREVRQLVDNAFEKAYEILEEKIDDLHTLAKGLLEYETLDGDEFKLLMEEGFEVLQEKIKTEKKKKEEERKKNKEKEEKALQKQEELLKESSDEHEDIKSFNDTFSASSNEETSDDNKKSV